MSNIDIITQQLEHAYRQIWREQMHDVPIINAQLNVEAVDFIEWQTYYLGVLLTPWFMNLVLIPQQPAEWQTIVNGEKRSYAFEAGEFEFIVGNIDHIGVILSCSLFSPMFEFEDHAAAKLTAQSVMQAIFNVEHHAQPTEQQPTSIPTVSKENLSRRDFFRGKFLNRQQTMEEQA